MTRTATHLIMGATGAGKTTLIRGLLAQRPRDEHWSILVNDFGAARVDAQSEVTVREVSGCMCCTAQVTLRAALVQVLRSTRPQRLFIEASAAAHPAAVRALLNEPGIAPAIELHPLVCVVNPHQFANERWRAREDYGEQIAAAQRVVVNRDDADTKETQVLLRWLQESANERHVIQTRDGSIPLDAIS